MRDPNRYLLFYPNYQNRYYSIYHDKNQFSNVENRCKNVENQLKNVFKSILDILELNPDLFNLILDVFNLIPDFFELILDVFTLILNVRELIFVKIYRILSILIIWVKKRYLFGSLQKFMSKRSKFV